MVVRALLLSVVGLMGLAATAHAFEGFYAERPFLGMTSRPLDQGLYQLEQGTRLENGSLTFPSLHRLGLGSDSELILSSPLVTLVQGEGRLADLSVGAKWRFAGGGELPALGVVGLAAVNDEGRIAPRLTLVADMALSGALTLGANLGASMGLNAAAWWHYTATLAWQLTDSLKVCTELVGEQAINDGRSLLGVDAGFGWLVEPSTQVDVLLYKGMAPLAPEWSASIGVSKRWGM